MLFNTHLVSTNIILSEREYSVRQDKLSKTYSDCEDGPGEVVDNIITEEDGCFARDVDVVVIFLFPFLFFFFDLFVVVSLTGSMLFVSNTLQDSLLLRAANK